MLLAAAVIPGQGLLRMLPYSIAKTTQDVNLDRQLADAQKQMQLPAALFPDEIGYGKPTPASDGFLQELPPGANLPWGQWLPPLLAWGGFLIACWCFMVGLGIAVFPQWRDNERLPFPLLEVQHQLIEGVDDTHSLPPLFKSGVFWLGCGIVMFLYALNGLNLHTDGKCPGFPLGWDLTSALSEDPWRNLHWHFRTVRIYFVLVGMSYFMPNRISFSIWFTVLAYGLYQMLATTYAPPYDPSMAAAHRGGATLAVALIVLYLGRQQWRRVAGSLFRTATTDEARRNRVAGWMLALGATGMFAWLVWAGVGSAWALLFVALGGIVSLVIARIVAETGIPFMRITALEPNSLLALFPQRWVSATSIYMGGFMRMIFHDGSRVNPTAITCHILGLTREGNGRRPIRLAIMTIAILTMGLAVAGAVHLNMKYHHMTSLDGVTSGPDDWGSRRMDGAQSQLLSWGRGAWGNDTQGTGGGLLFGFGLATILQTLCLMVPRWPLHPIGLLMVGHYYGGTAWGSILVGWLLKKGLTRHGGAASYRAMRPLFMGLILGEIFSAVLWAVIPVVLIMAGADPAHVGHLSILPK
jgi:hypothetical protein